MDAQGSQEKAKEDTAGLWLDADLVTDLSQYGEDLTATSPGAFGPPGAVKTDDTLRRITGATGRELYVRADLAVGQGTDRGVVWLAHGDATTDFNINTCAYLIGIDGTDRVYFKQGADVLLAATLTGLTVSATIQQVSAHWSTRPNPDTTGASDALISEFLIYGHTDEVFVGPFQVVHAVPTTLTGTFFAISGFGPTGIGWEDEASSSRQVRRVRVSAGWHPTVEAGEDWVAARTAYAGTLDDGIVEPLGPRPIASLLGEAGHFVGRAQVGYAAAHAGAVRRRAWSPIVNEVYGDAATLLATAAPANWVSPSPGSGVYSMLISWLRWVSVPAGATHAWVRVHVRSWVTGGAAVPLGLRCYALNRPPATLQIGQTQAPALAYHFAGEVLTANHSSSDGEWVELGLVALPPWTGPAAAGWPSSVHLCLAYAVDPAGTSANDAAARVKINAWHARTVALFAPGGLGDD